MKASQIMEILLKAHSDFGADFEVQFWTTRNTTDNSYRMDIAPTIHTSLVKDKLSAARYEIDNAFDESGHRIVGERMISLRLDPRRHE